MARLALLTRIAFAGARSRRAPSALSVLAVAGAAAALALATGVGAVAHRPFERTLERTNGAHVTVLPRVPGVDLRSIERLPGVVASTGPRPLVIGAFRTDGAQYGIRLVGVGSSAPEVARPLVVAGSWPADDGVLLEQSFARRLRLAVGDRLELGGATIRVSGIAVVALGQQYPRSQPGLAFARVSTLEDVQPDRAAWGALLGIRLANPEVAPAFAAELEGRSGGDVVAETWVDEREAAAETSRTVVVILDVYAALLLLSAGAVLATLVGARVLGQAREIGTLKATGLTPMQIATSFTLEQLVLGALGCLVGLVAGRVLTPLVTTESAALLQASGTPPLELQTAVAIGTGTLAFVLLFTALPALHIARRTTAETFHAGLSIGAGRSWLGRLAARARLPLITSLGASDTLARPGRSLPAIIVLALTIGSVVGTLGMEASLDVSSGSTTTNVDGPMPIGDPIDDDVDEAAALRPVVYGLDAALLVVGLIGLLATVILSVRERVRDVGLLLAVGLTPHQVARSLVSGQALVAALAALVGIPFGLAIFRLAVAAAGSGDEFAYPAWWALCLLPPATIVLVAALVAPLARRAAGLRVVDALRYE